MKFNSTYTRLTNAYNDPNINIIVLSGGKSSGKTYSTLQLLHQIALHSAKPKLISITSETLPHLKDGAIKDYIDILTDEDIYTDDIHNKSDKFFTIGKSKIQYFPAGIKSSKGPRRDILYMNEAIHCPFEAWDNLMTRTHGKKIIDFNPSFEFWAHEHLQGRADVAWINSTFRDNEYISKGELAEILRRKDDPLYANWWRVYGEGLIGNVEGLVYRLWQTAHELPAGAELIGYGMDFGFTNDPTALIAVYKFQSRYYIRELIYQTGLMGSDLIRLMRQLAVDSQKPIFADNSDPRLIEEIRRGGFNIQGVKKEKVTDSIEFSQKYLNFVTADSLNLIKELRNYMWQRDKKTDKWINEPIVIFNHACDAFRYAFLGLFGSRFREVTSYRFIKKG